MKLLSNTVCTVPSESVRVTGAEAGAPVSPTGLSYVVPVIAAVSRGTGDEDIWVFNKMRRRQNQSDRTFGGTVGSWVQRGLGFVAAAKTAYDVGKTLYTVGQAIAPYAGAALAFV